MTCMPIGFSFYIAWMSSKLQVGGKIIYLNIRSMKATENVPFWAPPSPLFFLAMFKLGQISANWMLHWRPLSDILPTELVPWFSLLAVQGKWWDTAKTHIHTYTAYKLFMHADMQHQRGRPPQGWSKKEEVGCSVLLLDLLGLCIPFLL